MSREIKMVPANFDWPLNKRWEGFKNPFYQYEHKCSACDGSGYGEMAQHLYAQWYGYEEFYPAMTGSVTLGADHPAILKFAHKNQFFNIYGVNWKLWRAQGEQILPLDDFRVKREARRLCNQCFDNHWSHHLSQDDVDALWEDKYYTITDHFKTKPTAKEINIYSITGEGFHGGEMHICILARCKKANVEPLCKVCEGNGHIWSPKEMEEQAEKWEKIEPPVGNAFQIWESVTEGSPISPPFEKPEDLANWMLTNDTSCTQGTTFDQWMKFITKTQWAPSAGNNAQGEVVHGVQL